MTSSTFQRHFVNRGGVDLPVPFGFASGHSVPFLGMFTHWWARQVGVQSRCSPHLSHVDVEPGSQERAVTPPPCP